MRNRASNKILSFALAAVMLFTLLPGVTVQAANVEIQSWQSTSITANDTAANTTVIGFGGKEWYVIGYNGSGVASDSDTMTLLAKNYDFGTTIFHSSSNEYSDSTLQTAMDNAYSGLTDSREQALIISRDLEGGSAYYTQTGYDDDKIAGATIYNAWFWPLSVAEANSLDSSVRQYSANWWLRSPGYGVGDAAVVYSGGSVGATGAIVYVDRAIRPAFSLDLSSVIFTSAASGGTSKPTAVAPSLSAAEPPTATDAIKLTVLDSGLDLDVDTTDVTAIEGAIYKSGDTVSIDYTGATLAADYISCVITEQDGTVLYYGKLDNGGSTTGSASFTVPALADDDYIIKLFAENCNGNNETDYASDPVNIALTVDNTKPTVTGVSPSGTDASTTAASLVLTFSEEIDITTAGTVTMSPDVITDGAIAANDSRWNSPTNTILTIPISGLDYSKTYSISVSGFQDAAGNEMDADSSNSFTTESGGSGGGGGWLTPGANLTGTAVYFGGYTGGGSSGPIKWHVVATDSDTATLWTTTSIGDRAYDSSSHDNWSGSDICAWLNGDFQTAAFSDAEQDAITNYGATEAGNYQTIDISQKIVLPSVAEIGNGTSTGTWGIDYTGTTNDGKRGFGDYWWLRSPGSTGNTAAFVSDYGYVDSSVYYVSTTRAIRPAFKLHLPSVIFTSNASGASVKSAATVGSGSLSAAQQPTVDIKLTVIDDTNLDLSVSGTSSITAPSGGPVNIAYTGAQIGAGRSVSVIIADSTGEPLFYGRPVNCEIGHADGTASFTVPSGLAPGDYKLLIFNEEVNGDYLTDYASTPVVIALKVDNSNAAPTINGQTGNSTDTINLILGYTEYTKNYTVTGTPAPTVSISGANTANASVTSGGALTIPAGLGVGFYETIIKAENTQGTATMTVTVKVTDSAPTATLTMATPTDATATIGEPFSKTFSVTYSNGTGTLGYSTGSTLPLGLSLNQSTGVLSGTPENNTEGDYPITVNVSAGTLSASGSFNLTVTAITSPAALTLTPPDNDTVYVGDSYTKTIAVTYTNGTGTLEYDATGLPSSLSINTGTGAISGTLTQNDVGEHNITITVDDGNGLSDSVGFTLTVIGSTPSVNHTVRFYSDNALYTSRTVTSGSALEIDWPDNPTKSNYSFGGWFSGQGGTGTHYTSSTVITADVDLYAKWTYNSSSSDSGGSSSSGDSGSTTTTVSSTITVNSIKTSYSATGGILTTNISAANLRSIVDNAYKNEDGGRIVKISYNGVSGSTSLNSLTLTFDATKLKADEDVTFIIETPYGVLIYTTEQMLQWFGGGFGTYIITLEKSSLKVNIKQDGKSVSWNALTPMARIGVAYTPKTGENTANLAVTDKNGRVLPTSVYEKGMVYADIFATGTYKAESVTPTAYTDITGHWAKDDINYTVMRGLIPGTSATAYSPDTAITRAEYLMALGKLSGANVSGYKTNSFTDVANDNPAMPYIEWAAANGIVQGVGNNKFAPDANITREEMALMMANYGSTLGYTLPAANSAAAYADSGKISGWAKDAVTAMQKAGIMTGRDNNTFDPQGNTTRGEAASILRRFVENVISSSDAEGWSNANTDLNKRVYYNQNGNAPTGWRTIDGEKYNFGSDGLMRTGWQAIDDKRYYFYSNGKMIAGKWAEIGGKWYYFYVDGTLAVSTTIDGYEVGADGVRK